jgi:glycosyltransferase 2 family protein
LQRQPESGLAPRGRRAAAGLLRAVLTVAVTVFIVRRLGLGLGDLSSLEWRAWLPEWGLFGLSCVLLLGGYVVSAVIWSLMVRDLGGPAIGLLPATEVTFISNLGRYVPGKLWQIAGLAILSRRLGIPVGVSTAAAVLGQAASLAGAALVGAVAFRSGLASPDVWVFAFFGFLALILVAVAAPPVSRRLVALWFRLSRSGEPTVHPSAGASLKWLGLYTANWILYSASFYVFVKSLRQPGDAVAVASAFAAAYVLGYAVLFAPAGIGVREGFLITFLSPSMGVPNATVISVLSRLWMTAIEVIPAAIFWGMHVSRDPVVATAVAEARGSAEPARGSER